MSLIKKKKKNSKSETRDGFATGGCISSDLELSIKTIARCPPMAVKKRRGLVNLATHTPGGSSASLGLNELLSRRHSPKVLVHVKASVLVCLKKIVFSSCQQVCCRSYTQLFLLYWTLPRRCKSNNAAKLMTEVAIKFINSFPTFLDGSLPCQLFVFCGASVVSTSVAENQQ